MRPEICILIISQVMSMLLVCGPHFEKLWFNLVSFYIWGNWILKEVKSLAFLLGQTLLVQGITPSQGHCFNNCLFSWHQRILALTLLLIMLVGIQRFCDNVSLKKSSLGSHLFQPRPTEILREVACSFCSISSPPILSWTHFNQALINSSCQGTRNLYIAECTVDS